MSANQSNPGSNGAAMAGLLVCVLGAGLMALFLPQVKMVGLAYTWLLVAAVMLVGLVCTGWALGKGAAGILIDPATNMMTLARFQVVVWTWLVLSAFVTVALGRVWDAYSHKGEGYCTSPVVVEEQVTCADPLGVQLPPLLWALMGISITTAVGSPLLKTNKQQKTAEDDRLRKQAALKSSAGGVAAPAATFRNVLDARKKISPEIFKAVDENAGALIKKASWREAAFSDLFNGDEVGTFGYVDVARVQACFFTLVACVAYAVTLWGAMATSTMAGFTAFPDLPSGLIAVIGISHTGYLSSDAFTQSTPT